MQMFSCNRDRIQTHTKASVIRKDPFLVVQSERNVHHESDEQRGFRTLLGDLLGLHVLFQMKLTTCQIDSNLLRTVISVTWHLKDVAGAPKLFEHHAVHICSLFELSHSEETEGQPQLIGFFLFISKMQRFQFVLEHIVVFSYCFLSITFNRETAPS